MRSSKVRHFERNSQTGQRIKTKTCHEQDSYGLAIKTSNRISHTPCSNAWQESTRLSRLSPVEIQCRQTVSDPLIFGLVVSIDLQPPWVKIAFVIVIAVDSQSVIDITPLANSFTNFRIRRIRSRDLFYEHCFDEPVQ